MQRLVVITGLSGSGKSLAADCLEDLGYFCVDNLPVGLIHPFYELIQKSASKVQRAALVIDIRGKDYLEEFPEIFHSLRSTLAPVELLFFDCGDEVLKRRFSETRRPHPMSEGGVPLAEAITRERDALMEIHNLADRIVDTSSFSVHQLRSFMKSAYGHPHGPDALNVNVVSFGFKYGVPTEADLMFDVRFLPNPYFIEDLRALTGLDTQVKEFLDSKKETSAFAKRLFEMMDYLVPLYVDEGKSYLTVAIGCTGGKHRSVAMAEALAGHLSASILSVNVNHRDLGRE